MATTLPKAFKPYKILCNKEIIKAFRTETERDKHFDKADNPLYTKDYQITVKDMGDI